MPVVQIAVALLVPVLALWAQRFAWARALGPAVLCYGAGILLGNVGLPLSDAVATSICEATVPLAIPLLLFPADIAGWRRMAPSLALSFVLAVVAAMAAALVMTLLFRAHVPEWWKAGGMIAGVYIGATANMNAVGQALDAHTGTLALMNAADIVVGGLYLLLLMTVMPRLLRRFLPSAPATVDEARHDHAAEAAAPGVWRWSSAGSMALAFALAVLVVGGVAGLALLVFGRMPAAFVFLGISVLALLLSLWSRVRGLRGSYELGELVLLVFCVAVGSLCDIAELLGGSGPMVAFFAATLVLTLLVHLGLARLLRVDADATLMASTATIYGPAFIGTIATAIGRRSLVGPGMLLALSGVGLGTALGLLVAELLRRLGGP